MSGENNLRIGKRWSREEGEKTKTRKKGFSDTEEMENGGSQI